MMKRFSPLLWRRSAFLYAVVMLCVAANAFLLSDLLTKEQMIRIHHKVLLLVVVFTLLLIVLLIDIYRRRMTEYRLASFVSLGERLSGVTSPKEVAQLIVEAADRLIGWHACFVESYDPAAELTEDILNIDIVDGERRDVSRGAQTALSSMMLKAANEGPVLVNRKPLDPVHEGATFFGDVKRRSSSLMCVAIRKHADLIGFLSVQSYKANAYNRENLRDLQWLADTCATALERARLQEQLRASEERYRVLLENNLDGVYLIQGMRFVYCNNAYARVFGYHDPKEIITGCKVGDLIAPEDRGRMKENLERRLEGHADSERFVFTGVRRDGSRLTCEVLGTRIVYEGQEAVLGTLRDISERERAEMEIQRVHEIYRKAIEAQDAVPYTLDYVSGRYDFLGGDIQTLTGYSATELNWQLFASRVRKVEMLGAAKDISAEERFKKELAGEFDNVRGDFLFERKDGSTIWLADASIPRRTWDDRVIGSLGILMDISERKAAETRAMLFASLGARLSAAPTSIHAARVIAEAADELFGWDACAVDLYNAETDTLIGLLGEDEVDGKRQVVDGAYSEGPPSQLARKVMYEGPQLILRDSPEELEDLGATRFGDKERRSLSMLFAPMLRDGQPIGFLSFHSYKKHAYSQRHLEDLVFLAEHCAAGLEKSRLYELLRESEERFRTVWEHAGSGMRLTDSEGIIRMANPAFCRLVGLPKEQLEGSPFCIYYSGEVRERVMHRYRERFTKHTVENVLERTMKLWNGEDITFQISNTFVSTPEGLMVLGVFHDRTAEKNMETQLRRYANELERLATTDSLTGLFNRRHFMERLGVEVVRAQRYSSPLTLLMMDLDHFKRVNDTYGHLVGDDVLSKTGDLIREIVRVTDIPGRFGGEEFCIIMPETDMQGAQTFGERLRKRMADEECVSASGQSFRVTCSIGIALLNGSVRETNDLLAAADQALYRAKEMGRDRVCLA